MNIPTTTTHTAVKQNCYKTTNNFLVYTKLTTTPPSWEKTFTIFTHNGKNHINRGISVSVTTKIGDASFKNSHASTNTKNTYYLIMISTPTQKEIYPQFPIHTSSPGDYYVLHSSLLSIIYQ
jgi:hypothetical protein